MRHLNRVASFAVVLALAVPATEATLRAAAAPTTPPGSFDKNRAGGGKVTTDVVAGNAFEAAAGAAQTPDDKIVVAGTVDNRGTTRFDMFVVRYKRDGRIDTSFSGDGIASVDFGGIEVALDVAVQKDGKIVVFGAGTGFDLARFNRDGSLDSSFDGDGKATTNFAGPVSAIGGMIIQPNGKIVAAGATATGPGATNFDTAFARYNAAGSLDPSFSGDGTLVTGISPGAASDAARDVALQRDGKIVAAGSAVLNGTDFAFVRLTAGGTLDSSFGGDGSVIVSAAPGQNTDAALAVAVQPDRKIVAAGAARIGANNTNFDSATVRVNAGGSLDRTFGGDGIVTRGIAPGANDDLATGIAVKPSLVQPRRSGGRLSGIVLDDFELIETGSEDDETGDEDCWVENMESDGALDREFLGRGLIEALFAVAGADECVALILYNPKLGARMIVTIADIREADADRLVALAFLLADEQTKACIAIRCRYIEGTHGADLIVGTNGVDDIEALRGNDLVRALGGNDVILSGGGPGNDTIYGGRGNDKIDGAGGNDRLFGEAGNDLLLGGKGNDALNGGSGRDRCVQGPGKSSRISCERR